jgi:hypothetical protein
MEQEWVGFSGKKGNSNQSAEEDGPNKCLLLIIYEDTSDHNMPLDIASRLHGPWTHKKPSQSTGLARLVLWPGPMVGIALVGYASDYIHGAQGQPAIAVGVLGGIGEPQLFDGGRRIQGFEGVDHTHEDCIRAIHER